MVSANKIDVRQGVGRILGLGKEFNYGFKAYQLSATVKCEMDFQKFPFDEHVCNLEVGSILYLFEKIVSKIFCVLSFKRESMCKIQ